MALTNQPLLSGSVRKYAVMSMSPEDMAAFFADEAAQCLSVLDARQGHSEPYLIELNLQQAAQNFLMSALIDWRHGLADPRPRLRLAMEQCLRAVRVLPMLHTPTPPSLRFRFFDVVFLGLLLDASPPEGCLALIRECQATARAEVGLDYALAAALLGEASALEIAIPGAEVPKRQLLMRDTYSAYAELLKGNSEQMPLAEANFVRRRSDAFYSGGLQIDGGGPDNGHVIDYRLAAIIKARKLPVESLHVLI